MDPATTLALYLFVLRPPRPDFIYAPRTNVKGNKLKLDFQLSIEQFIGFPVFAVAAWYWWLQIEPRPNVEWEIFSVLFLKTVVVVCNFLYKIEKKGRTTTQKKILMDKQIVALIVIIFLYGFLLYYGLAFSSVERNLHPFFAAFVFTACIFYFAAFQFDFIYLEDEI